MKFQLYLKCLPLHFLISLLGLDSKVQNDLDYCGVLTLSTSQRAVLPSKAVFPQELNG